MKSATQSAADRVNDALLVASAALAKLGVAVVTRGTVDQPHHSVRTAGGIVYGSWTPVQPPSGWWRWKAIGMGSSVDVAAYVAAEKAVQVAVRELLAMARVEGQIVA